MKKTAFVAFAVAIMLLFQACKEDKKTDHLLSKEKMTDLMYELTLLNSAKSMVNVQDSITVIQNSATILKKYGLDSLHFVEQHRYYASQENVYAEIFDSIHKRLEREIKILEALPEDPKDEIKIDKMPNIKLSKAIENSGLPVIKKKQSSK